MKKKPEIVSVEVNIVTDKETYMLDFTSMDEVVVTPILENTSAGASGDSNISFMETKGWNVQITSKHETPDYTIHITGNLHD